MSAMVALSAVEVGRLAVCEGVIDRGLRTFVEVGEALGEIRDSRLYRATHLTFDLYCRVRWGMSAARAYQLIDAKDAVDAVSTIVETAPPSSEAVARELPKDREAARETWAAAVDEHGERPTARQVRETRERLEGAQPEAPDPVQAESIANRFRRDGIEAAREIAASMGVACPSAEELAARPVPTAEPMRAETTVPSSAGGEVVDLSERQRARSAAAVRRLRNVTSACRSIREIADGGIPAEDLLAGAEPSELLQAMKDIQTAKRQLAVIERELSSRLKASA